ncbi:MAG: hypothetical protein CL878_02995 [Dehalococcoidia bacterium]|nr:hypothetical protein [Dehalococcoidia bacterium]
MDTVAGSLGTMTAAIPPSPTYPTLGPTFTSAYQHGWRQLGRHFWWLLLVLGIQFLVQLIAASLLVLMEAGGSAMALFGLTAAAIVVFAAVPLPVGALYAYLRAARGQQPRLREVVSAALRYPHAVLAGLLVASISSADTGYDRP